MVIIIVVLGLFAGLMLHRKGIDTIIKTVNKLKDENFKMLLVGKGPEIEKYKKMMKEFELQDKIIFTGQRKDMKNFYRSVDLLFFPSRGEGLAGVIMEAMSASLPILSSRIPCTTDLVKNGENGYLCEIEDADCYAKHLKKLIEDKNLREKLGKKSKELIKNFTWKKSIEKFEKLYKEK